MWATAVCGCPGPLRTVLVGRLVGWLVVVLLLLFRRFGLVCIVFSLDLVGPHRTSCLIVLRCYSVLAVFHRVVVVVGLDFLDLFSSLFAGCMCCLRSLLLRPPFVWLLVFVLIIHMTS